MSEEKIEINKNIEKGISDKLEYGIITLKNGLKVLLISDKSTKKSACSLTVKVGSFADPKDVQGLAHFCEHLLFMGSKKYSKENQYDEFLTQNDGFSNAHTLDESTSFYFDISNDAFGEALNIFSEFFKEPLFKEDSIEREIEAIESEFNGDKQDQDFRLECFLAYERNKDSVFSNFTIGNKKSILKDNNDPNNYHNLRDKVMDFYNKYYSSNAMQVILYNNQSLEEMSELAKEKFKDIREIPNYNPPSYKYDPKLNNFGLNKESDFQHMYKLVPIEDEDVITFKWFFEYEDTTDVLNLSFLSNLFGHEGPNSLCASLKKDTLISKLVTSFDTCGHNFNVFNLEITLTEKGYNNYKDVILRVLKYIQVIQQQEINKRFYDEVKLLNKIGFDYKNKKEPIEYVEDYTETFLEYPNEKVLSGNVLLKEYKPDILKKYLNFLNIKNLNIYFSSKDFKDDCSTEDELNKGKINWMDINYKRCPFEFTQTEIDNYIVDSKLGYPSKNEFFPENLELLPIPPNTSKYPEKIKDIDNYENCEIWHLQNVDKEKFNIPKCIIKIRLDLKKNLNSNSDIKNHIISILLKKITQNEINEQKYLASEAKFKLNISYDFYKCTFKIEGFNDSLKRGLNILLTMINELGNKLINNKEEYNEKLKIITKKYLNDLKNIYIDPSIIVGLYKKAILIDPKYTIQEYIDYLENETTKITIDDLINYHNNMFKDVKEVALLQGNITKEQAKDLIKEFNDILKIDISKDNSKNSYYNFKNIKLKDEKGYLYTFDNNNEDENQSFISCIYQFGKLDDNKKQYLFLLDNYLDEKFFDQLRTKESLGYKLSSTTNNLNFENYYNFQILGKICPEKCKNRIFNFIKETEKLISNLNDDEFNDLINSRISFLSQPDPSMKYPFLRYWKKIKEKSDKFNTIEISLNELKKPNNITKQRLIDFYKEYFCQNPRKLVIEYIAPCHLEENKTELKNSNEIVISNIEQFKKNNYQ